MNDADQLTRFLGETVAVMYDQSAFDGVQRRAWLEPSTVCFEFKYGQRVIRREITYIQLAVMDYPMAMSCRELLFKQMNKALAHTAGRQPEHPMPNAR